MNFSGRENDAYTGKLRVADRNANLKKLADLKSNHLTTQVATGMYTGQLSSHHAENDSSRSTRSSNVVVSPPATTRLTANYFAFIKLAAIRIWLRDRGR